MADLKVAVIGCGGHAQEHFRMIAAEPRLRLVAISEIDGKRLEQNRRQWKPERAFSDYRRMLDTCAVDLVHICTMPGHLTPIAMDCLQRDLHTSLEKPPGMSASDTEKLAAVARRSKGENIVSFNRRYFPEVLAVRRLVQQRGGPVHCAATYNKHLDLIGSRAWAHLTPPSIICDAIHHVDLLRWLAGRTPTEAARATAVYSLIEQGERDGACRHNAVIHFDSGTIATMMHHSGVGFRIRRAEVHAEDFSAYLDLNETPQCELYQAVDQGRGQGARGEPYRGELDLEPTGGPHFDETRHFANCILGAQTPWSTLEDAVHTMRLGEAIGRGHKGPI